MSKNNENTQPVSEEEFFIQRSEFVTKSLAEGKELYPHKFEVKESFAKIFEYSQEQSAEELNKISVQSAGRIMSFRLHARFSFFKIQSLISLYKLLLIPQQLKTLKF